MTLSQIFHFLFDIVTRCNSETRVNMCEEFLVDKKAESFKMPVHYPRYKKEDYEKMEDWKLDNLLQQYGLGFDGTLEEKRAYAMGAFLWPHQL
ncbi:hypothetical protein ACJIZ3_006737 [Penstemon smallii]|uniref:DUF7722 domain-containing protein n=1 Tax=Penstemon smallii TaxID=265156 RepID=A0ABD3S8M4_9LAMI